jgi:hypothetical protein
LFLDEAGNTNFHHPLKSLFRTRPLIVSSTERLSNSFSTVIKLWKPSILRNLEDGDHTFSETSVRTSAARYKVPDDIFKEFVPFTQQRFVSYNLLSDVSSWYIRSITITTRHL